jgi:hypothetical protein
VKKASRLVHLPHLQAAFRQHCYRHFKEQEWPVDPVVWTKDWGVQIQPVGGGAAALKYLGTYVARTAISDSRILEVTDTAVRFRWKDRQHDRTEALTLSGVEFVRRYLRHVLPRGLRSVRYYGFCHPAAKARRLRVQCHAGKTVQLGATVGQIGAAQPAGAALPPCSRCGGPTQLLCSLRPWPPRQRGPPQHRRLHPLHPVA